MDSALTDHERAIAEQIWDRMIQEAAKEAMKSGTSMKLPGGRVVRLEDLAGLRRERR